MGRPAPEKAAELARQICAGLAAAHEAGVLHRDLKPANIMIDGRGRARITDFGLARLAAEREDIHEFAGTPGYMAPEQRSAGQVSVQSDLYSLGLVLHELFTGRRFSETESVAERHVHRGSGSSPSSFPDLDPAVERAVKRCLETEPSARPRSVYEVLASLPGGDPLAAALAAGETPSPELVASARSKAAMSPRVLVLLVLWVLGSITAMSFVGGRTIRLPERAPSELAVVALEIATRDLGFSELPPHDRTGLLRNPLYGNEKVRPYAVWRRWSPRPIEPRDFHNPELFDLYDRSHALPGGIAIVLDDTGVLLSLSVVLAPRPHDPTEEADLGPILARAMIDEKTIIAERVDPFALDPPLPVHCDHVTVWRDVSSGEEVARAGVTGGQVVAFERIGRFPSPTQEQAKQEDGFWAVMILMIPFLLMAFLGVRNLRLGRGDLRGAILTSAVSLVVYLLREAFAVDQDKGVPGQFIGLLGGRAAGHAVLHAAQLGTIYLAIEPIARRVWPRALIGWARLIGGRLTDPRVGAEILVGFAAACVVVLGLALAPLFSLAGERVLPDEQLLLLGNSAATSSVAFYGVSAALFSSMFAVAIIGVGHLISGRSRYGLVVAAILLSMLHYIWGLGWGYDFVLAAVYGAAHGVIATVLFVRGGLVATTAFFWLTNFLILRVLTTDLGTWYTPAMIFTVLVVLLVLGYAARAALVGRER
jgi:serine/threonine-protein kinase